MLYAVKAVWTRLRGEPVGPWFPTGEVRHNKRKRIMEQRWYRMRGAVRDECWRPHGSTPEMRAQWSARAEAESDGYHVDGGHDMRPDEGGRDEEA